MSIVGAFDVHRRQLTFEYLDAGSGELKRGRVVPADRHPVEPAGRQRHAPRAGRAAGQSLGTHLPG